MELENGKYEGYSRAYVLASEIVGYTDSKIDSDLVKHAINSYQVKKLLTIEELLILPIFLKISIIQNIAEHCEKIYVSQIQKYKVEDICARIIDNKEEVEYNKNRFKINVKNKFDYSDLKNSFIEYMSYKLKRKGSKGNPYLEVLSEQVKYTGTTVEEIIKKEHFHIATIKNSLGNAITSIKNINRMNFKELFENVNKVEEILNNDPADIFKYMTADTKDMYMNIITEISKKTKISEIYISTELINLANRYKLNSEKEKNGYKNRKSHIGYYLIDEGKTELLSILKGKKIKKLSLTEKSIIFVRSTFYVPILLDFLLIFCLKLNVIYSILAFILLLIPVSEIYIKTITYILSKIIKNKKLPKLNLDNKIPEEYSTFVVIPTILKNKKKIDELIKKIEVYYLANKSENIYFGILGDCTSSSKEVESFDKEIIEYGKEKILELNNKYENKNIFHFLYRKRRWNASERQFLGWERKRGLLNQFNNYILFQNKSDFIANTLEDTNFNKKIKYVITLDSDTNLVLNSAFSMVGAMAHILNTPVIKNKRVIHGYGIMQPRIGIGLKDSIRSTFSRIYSGSPGTNLYANAVSDFYQDVFGEAIFTGKGIYDLNVYDEIMTGEISENEVLSHDLLEGNYLRCGLLEDVTLLDNYPYKFTSYILREHRWIRGDWQLLKWLKREKNKINLISKYKIYDNLRRSMLPIMQLILFFIAFIENSVFLMIIDLISLFLPLFYTILDKVLFKKSQNLEIINAYKNFSLDFSGLKGEFIKVSLNFAFLPSIAYMSLNAIVKTIYRLIKKTKLLEWVTSEEIDKKDDNSVEAYYKIMFLNLVAGIVLFGFLNPFGEIIGTLWLLAPFISWYISIDNYKLEEKNKFLKEDEKKYLYDIGKKTWNYFYEYMNKDTNYLPPDNYQLGRKDKIVYRTSSTNIGLGVLAIISAYDLEYINFEEAIKLLKNTLETIDILEKWNGHLYNWYDIKTLEPLNPRYVSTVDSGNFVGYMYVLKTFLEDNKKIDNKDLKDIINNLIKKVDNFIYNADFSVLYSKKDKLLSIGYDAEKMKLTDSYYDFLASEARQASFIAIAKKDIDEKHWANLSRTLTTVDKYKGLISWSGTTFEYLMPNININSYYGSLLDESCKFMIMSQIKYANKLGVPWGISESAYNVQDLNANYQYKAFGIPWLGLKRGLEEELVISPYSTFLSLEFVKDKGIENLKRMEKENAYGEYGFYEAIDYTKFRLNEGEDYKVVKTYMAHHQGLILTSINNLINNKILNKRFFENPEIESADILLQEKMPNTIMISKNSNDKLRKQKYINEFYDKEMVYRKNEIFNRVNVISSDDYTIVMDNQGRGYSKYKDIQINRFGKDDIYSYLNGFFIKNIKTNKVWSTSNCSDSKNYEARFSSSKIQYNREDEGIETEYKIINTSNNNAEIRRITFRNMGFLDETLEVTGVVEGIFSNINHDIAHPVFNNMFLNIEYIEEKDLFIIQRNDRDESNSKYWFAIKLYSNNLEETSKTRFEIDKEKFIGRKNLDVPVMINNSQNFENIVKDVIEPIIAINKQLSLKFDSEITLDFIISVSENREELIKQMDEYENEEKRNSEFKLFKSKSEEEIKYLRLNGDMIETYQKILGHVISNDIPKDNSILERVYKSEYTINDLWKYGISGDNPIFAIKIKNVDDIDVVKEMLKAFEFYRVKNINMDLCIINGEEHSYELVLRELILQAIREIQLEYLINNKIFIIDEYNTDKKDLDLIYCKSSFYLEVKYGSLKLNLNDIENKAYKNIIDKKKKDLPILVEEKERSYSDVINNNLLFFNGIGGFSSDGKEYIFKSDPKNEVPMPWSNVLSNDKFGCITTDNFGGFIWSRNSRLNRITKWNNEPTLDIPSEIIYIKDKDENKYWSMFSRVANDMEYVVKNGHGYSNYMQVCDDILQNITVFVNKDKENKDIIISLKNLKNDKRKLKLYYYIENILGEDIGKTAGNIICRYDENKIYFKNVFKNQFEKEVKIASTEKISKIYKDKKEFFGSSINLKCPVAIKYENNKNIENENCNYFKTNSVITEYEIELAGLENKEIVIRISSEKDNEVITIDDTIKELDIVKNNWTKVLSGLKINTPSQELNMFINSWCMYQTISSRILARTAYYQSGGAIGYRDQLQDTLGLKFLDVSYMKEFILKAAKHQFVEGDVLHWWHESNGLGVRTKFSDDLLWLVYLVIEYIDFTDDMSILDIMVPYVQGEKLKPEELEKCKIYNIYGREESIFEHCIRAIEKGINLGQNNIPKIGTGDWNDGFSNIGAKGNGESIWLGFFIYDILKRFEKILERLGKYELIDRYKIIRDVIKKALNNFAWDEKWYIRAVTDTGEIIGSRKNEECKIDSISQSWSVISEAGDNDKKYIAMDSVNKYLVDREEKIIKLLTPAFNNKEYDPGYISKYKNGIRENGGQYTHGVIWTVIAFAKLGFGDTAFELLNILNPINHANSEVAMKKYKGEPYVLAGDVYSNKDMYGRAGWTWYTGAASWYYKVAIENILGFNIKDNRLYINPCIPKGWEEYSINYLYKNTKYKIIVKNKNNKNNEIMQIKVNGIIQENDYIELLDDNRDFTIEIEM